MPRQLNGTAPLRAICYVRKSSEDREKTEDLRSTGMQEANARRFAAKHGWQVLKVFRDDNISGALISRPAYDALKADLGIPDGTPIRRAPDPAKLPFDIILCRDQSRLIRNGDHATHQIRRFLRAGVRLAYYRTGEVLDAATFKPLAVGVQGFVDADHREQARANVREGMAEYAKRGHSCGGTTYGYTARPVIGKSPTGQPVRLHSEYVVNPAQARVVRQVFAMYRAGFGLRTVSRTANGEYPDLCRRFFNGKRPPKPGSAAWSPFTVRDMLRNERYAGVLTFGRTQKQEDDNGATYRIRQSDPERIVRVKVPSLRIVPPALWSAVQRRLAKIRNQTLRLRGRA